MLPGISCKNWEQMNLSAEQVEQLNGMGAVAVGVNFESIGWAMHQWPWPLAAERLNVWLIDQRHWQKAQRFNWYQRSKRSN